MVDENRREERRARRYDLSRFTLRYVADDFFSLVRRPKAEERKLVNMSALGLAFQSGEHFPTGRRLKLTITGSQGLFPPDFTLRGDVVYCHKVSRENVYHVGVAFTSQAKDVEETLGRFDELAGNLPMRIQCRNCSTVIKVKKKHEGRTIPCPRCHWAVKLVEQGDEDSLEEVELPDDTIARVLGDSMKESEGKGAPGRRLDPRIRRLVQKFIPSIAALRVFEAVTSQDQSPNIEIATDRLAQELAAPNYRVGTALKRLEEHGVLRKKMSGIFEYEPSEEARAQADQLRKALQDPDIRRQVEATLR